MQAHLTKDGNKAVLKLSGRFDFNTHREFRAAVDPLVADPRRQCGNDRIFSG